MRSCDGPTLAHIQADLPDALMQEAMMLEVQLQGEKKVVGNMGAGEFFGELALIRQNSTRAADCVALQRTKVRSCSGACRQSKFGNTVQAHRRF